MILAALLYSVQVLSAPRNSVAVLAPTQAQVLMEPVPYRRPSTIALSRDGVAAFAIGNSEVRRVGNNERIVIDGATMKVLSIPGRSTLARSFLAPELTDLIKIRNVAISSGDKAVASFLIDVQGAYGATQEASYAWNGSMWTQPFYRPFGPQPENVCVVAAGAEGALSFTGDYLYLDPAHLTNPRGDNLFNVAMVQDGKDKRILGHGTVTALSGKYSVGYNSDYFPGSYGMEPVNAVQWIGERRLTLGAGVAWGVDREGDVVGDNRRYLQSAGVPVVWHRSQAMRLSEDEGTAFAINDDGTIIGAIKSRAFIANLDRSGYAVRFLDNLVTPGWRVQSAYYVSSNGVILALASRNGSLPRLVLLHPLGKSATK